VATGDRQKRRVTIVEEYQKGEKEDGPMKKKLLAMTILVALSFVVSIISIAPATQKIQKSVDFKPKAYEKAKEKFWDLAVDHFVINGQSFPFANDYNQAKIINVKVGQTVNCLCFYKVKTITIGDITAADAAYWGSGNLTYKIAGGLFFPGPPSHQEYTIKTRQTPKFTSADVQSWKNQYGANGKKEWVESLVYNWTAKPEHVGKTVEFHFDVDSFLNIKETDEQNNGSYGATGIVAKFIVTPVTSIDKPLTKATSAKISYKIRPSDLHGIKYPKALSPAFYDAWKKLTDSYDRMVTFIPVYEEQAKKYTAKCKECKNRTYTQEDMDAAGCLPSDPVVVCSQKLFRWCVGPTQTQTETAGMALFSLMGIINTSSKTAQDEVNKSLSNLLE
jgi:hypothetical protein